MQTVYQLQMIRHVLLSSACQLYWSGRGWFCATCHHGQWRCRHLQKDAICSSCIDWTTAATGRSNRCQPEVGGESSSRVDFTGSRRNESVNQPPIDGRTEPWNPRHLLALLWPIRNCLFDLVKRIKWPDRYQTTCFQMEIEQ